MDHMTPHYARQVCWELQAQLSEGMQIEGWVYLPVIRMNWNLQDSLQVSLHDRAILIELDNND